MTKTNFDPNQLKKSQKMIEISSSKRQFIKEISCFKRQNQLSKKSKISCWLPLKSLILPTVQIEIDCKWFRKNKNKVAFLQFFLLLRAKIALPTCRSNNKRGVVIKEWSGQVKAKSWACILFRPLKCSRNTAELLSGVVAEAILNFLN